MSAWDRRDNNNNNNNAEMFNFYEKTRKKADFKIGRKEEEEDEE